MAYPGVPVSQCRSSLALSSSEVGVGGDESRDESPLPGNTILAGRCRVPRAKPQGMAK